MQPITLPIIRKHLRECKSIDTWNVDSFFQDGVNYIKARRNSKDITLEEAQELRRDVQALQRYLKYKRVADAWVVQKYAIKAYTYKIRVLETAMSWGDSAN